MIPHRWMSGPGGTMAGMCGRYASTKAPADLADEFRATDATDGWSGPDYNVAPTRDVVAVVQRHPRDADGTPDPDRTERTLRMVRWGLVPSWAKDAKSGARMINARSETILTSSAFKRSFTNRRCIVPADGFYEWQAVPGQKKKQPWYVSRTDGDVFAFAGLWDSWRPVKGSDEGRLVSCTIITTDANEAIRPIHDRMPVVLPPGAWAEWLDPANDDVDDLARLLVPAPKELVTLTPVRTDVNDVRNDGPHLVEPLPADEVDEPTLF
jgi:putative SOS response-associated peptidase YedK